MKPALIILTAWLLFGGSHLLLSSSNLRVRLADRFGPRGFTLIFAGVTLVSMLVLISAVTIYGAQGYAGLGIESHVSARWGLGIIGGLGGALAIAGLINYPRSPMAILAQRQREYAKHTDLTLAHPTAIERLTRHPFFVGLAVLMGAHALLANSLASMVYFLGFVVLSLTGIWLQDRKLRARWKETYAAFEAETSNIPFTARPASTDADLDPEWGRWTIALVISSLLFGALHPFWSYANGALFSVFILVFGLLGVAKGLSTKA